jgi:hypothetical protein
LQNAQKSVATKQLFSNRKNSAQWTFIIRSPAEFVGVDGYLGLRVPAYGTKVGGSERPPLARPTYPLDHGRTNVDWVQPADIVRPKRQSKMQ